jgi:CheY-like chemotaxis protein
MPTKILIADDQDFVRKSIRSMLVNKTGWQVCEAENGKVAVDVTKAKQPDVAVLDIVMPVMGGLGAAYEIAKVAPDTKIGFQLRGNLEHQRDPIPNTGDTGNLKIHHAEGVHRVTPRRLHETNKHFSGSDERTIVPVSDGINDITGALTDSVVAVRKRKDRTRPLRPFERFGLALLGVMMFGAGAYTFMQGGLGPTVTPFPVLIGVVLIVVAAKRDMRWPRTGR